MSRQFIRKLVLTAIVIAAVVTNFTPLPAQDRPRLSLATFVAEVTPPIGSTLAANPQHCKPVVKIADPLYAHGIVLLGAGDPIVLVSVDWCAIGNDAHDRWRKVLADAAVTKPERVLVCAIHQHDAPYADLEAERLFSSQKLGKTTLDLDWHERTLQRVAATLTKSLKEARPFTHIGMGEAKVERVASNRRILGKDGKVELVRLSSTKDPRAKEAPEGLIDPWLKTLSFWNGDKALASISVYATHPISFYGLGNVSSDFPGDARRRRQADDPGVLHFYATGCGGNLAAGKYNDGSPEAREQLGERLYKAWKSAWEQTKKHPLGKVGFRSIPVRLEPKDTAGFQSEDLKATLTGDKTELHERARVAAALSWRKRCDAKKNLDIPVLDFGPAQLLLLPGEPFVEYQLFAQQQRPDSFVLTLGYGDYGPVYIPTDKAFAEGGFEPGDWSFVGVGVEKQLKDAIAKGLGGGKGLILATDGKTSFVIVTAVKPTPEEKTASEWLAATLGQVTGAKFPIRSEDAKELPKTIIRVGANPRMESEEWRIRTAGDALLLEGGKPRGTIYAVCEFLETHVGVYRLDPFTEVVPNKPTLTIPTLDRRGRPAFAYRIIFTGFPYAHAAALGENNRRWRTWNKEHSFPAPVTGPATAPATGDYPRMVPEGVHTFGMFLSAKEFAATHPEYFSMDAEGKRMTNDRGEPAYWIQLCVTNEDVRRITLERAKQMLVDDQVEAKETGREPAKLLVLSQNDNTENLCLCPKCQAISRREGSESGALLDYVNHVARGLKTDFPDVLVMTEAYNFTLQPPKTIRPESNVMIRYIDNYGLSDMTRPLRDPRNAKMLALLDGWAKISKNLAVWDYWRTFDTHPPGLLAPSTNARAMRSDLKLFRERGVRFVSVEATDFMGYGLDEDDPMSSELQSFMPLRAWLGMKLLDDPARDLDSLLDAFCRGYYGAAAKPMRALLELIEDRQEKTTANSSARRRHVWLEAMCDAAFLAAAYRHLDGAIVAAAKDAPSLTHVRRERIIIDSAYLWLEAAVRRNDPAIAAKLPKRGKVMKRHREDWSVYLKSVFDKEGQAKVAPFIEQGVQLLEKLEAKDTDAFRLAVAVAEKEVTFDGPLREPFWQKAEPMRLLPRDPKSPNEDASAIRFAWTAEALYVGIEQPSAAAAAAWEVSLMATDRQGVQVALFVQPSGNIGANFYSYSAEGGMVGVKGRKSLSRVVSTNDKTKVVAEIRIPWSDLPAQAKAGSEFLVNIGTYPKADSKTPTYVSSPWLVGTAPTYNPAFHGTIRLE